MSWQAAAAAAARELDAERVSLHPELDRDWSPAARVAAARAMQAAVEGLRPYLTGQDEALAHLDESWLVASAIVDQYDD